VARRNHKGRDRTDRYVSLRHWLLQSRAWLSLPAAARAIYIQLASRYNGSNNGRISYSVREGAQEVNVTKDTAGRMLKVLQDRGFIAPMKRGAFSHKVSREASEWLLAEYDNDIVPEHATKTFMRWQPPEPEHEIYHPPKSRTRSAPSDRTVRLPGPTGTTRKTDVTKNGVISPSDRTVTGRNRDATVRPERHL
jgi:hypothetical protein